MADVGTSTWDHTILYVDVCWHVLKGITRSDKTIFVEEQQEKCGREVWLRYRFRIFGPKTVEATQWGASYFVLIPKRHQADEVKENEVGGAYGTHRKGEEVVQGFGGKARREETFGRPRCRWEDGIRIDLRDIGWEDVELDQLAQDRGQWRAVVNEAMNLRVLASRS
jgi:hypothetical protein